MSLLGLPREILVTIFEDDSLGMDDYKALRCTAKLFDVAFTPEVFRRLPMSKSWKDWNRFCEIASRPHLAQSVQELVWHELIEDSRILCHSQGMEEGCWCEIRADEETPVTAHELAPLAREVFWLTPEMCDAAYSDELATFQEQFLSRVDKLPRLDSFVSVPMPPEYVLSREPYEFTAQLFYRSLGLTGPGFSRHSVSSGLFRFLSPAMMRDSSEIRRLHFIDHRIRSAIYNFTESHLLIFEKLTHVNLCLNLVPVFGDIVTCLKRALNLEWLRVCVEGEDHNQPVISTLFAEEPIRQWPKLLGLEFVGVETTFPGRAIPRQNVRRALLAFFEGHAPTLRHLSMHSCGLKFDVVKAMAAIPEFHLESFRISEPDCPLPDVEEHELLALVNKASTAGMDIEEWFGDDDALALTSSNADTSMVEGRRIALSPDFHRPGIDLESDSDHSPDFSVYAHDKCESGAPKWRRSHRNGYTATDHPHGKRTREWEFRHHSGAEATGDEPLEFFSDWDSDSDSGDYSVSLPLTSDRESFPSARPKIFFYARDGEGAS